MRGLGRKSPPKRHPHKDVRFPVLFAGNAAPIYRPLRLTGEGAFLECLDVPPAEAAHFI
jgi:hypothetical protein